MLEEPTLLLEPWIAVWEEPGPKPGLFRKVIRSASTGQALGFARRRPPLFFWSSWLAAEVVEVLETEDASLLMTLRRWRGPFQTWKVYDAEERQVGKMYHHILWDREGRKLAKVQRRGKMPQGVFQDPNGRVLGTFAIQQDQNLLLSFSDLLSGNPFGRMILLGTVLTWK